MSAFAGPSTVTSGLVFDYDMSNTKKSWKGAPITNYIPTPYASWNGSSFVLGYNYQNLGATYTYRTGVNNPVDSPGVLEYYTGTSGYKYFSIDSTSLPSTTTYTFSYYARLTGAPAGGNNTPIDSQLWRANGSDRSVTGNWNPTFTFDWVRYSTTGPAEASTILQYFPVHSGNIIGGYTIQYCGFQLEVGSVATPFVVGSRSTSQAIVDLTGKNTLTATSLTYASNGQFSFNGTSDYLTVARTLTTPITISGFLKYTDQAKTAGMYLNSYPHTVLGISINRSGGGQLVVYIGNGSTWLGTPSITSSINMTVDVWYHLAFVSNGATSDLYLNGVNVGTVGHAPSGWGNYFAMGMIVQTGEYYKGTIGTTQIYDRALSAAEVIQNFNALRSRYGL